MTVLKTSPLPGSGDPVITRRRTFTPVWYKFIKPLLDQTNDNTVQLSAVSDDLTTASAAILAEATVRASADGALASQITSINAAYQAADAALTASISSEATSRANADSAEATTRAAADAALTSSLATVSASVTTETAARVTADAALATQITALTAAYQAADAALTASISNEATVRASADSSLASSIASVQSAYQAADATLTASVTSEANTRAAGDAANATQITSVQATLTSSIGAVSASVSTEASARIAADGSIQAHYGIDINANGRVVGGIRLDGGATLSTFAVLADKFVIVHPSADGTTITAFISGLVDGVSTIGINGNLLVDGTILARSLLVDQLSAVSADLGTCTAGVIQSADGKFVIDLNNKTLTITA